MKTSFLSARTSTEISQVGDALPGWCERKDNRTRQATYLVPAQVFAEEEGPAFRPLLPSVREASPTNLISQGIGGRPFLLHKASKYSLPGTSASRPYVTR